MLNFKNTTFLFVALLLALCAGYFFYTIPFWIIIVCLLLYTIILFYGSYYIGSGFYIKAICRGNGNKREIAISFDDGPVQNYTLQIAEILKQHQTSAAFFCIGNRINGNENIIKHLQEEGHIIGNHSYSHAFWFDLYSKKQMQHDLQKMDMAVKDVIGVKPKLFRPPYGVTTPNLASAIKNGGYTTVGWSIRSYDTVIADENKLFNKLTAALKPGSVVLFHDTGKTTLAVLPKFIQHVKNNGYTITRLDKMFNLTPYE
jgi:peptidoglycan-N-acetylglucosamine deacetylase